MPAHDNCKRKKKCDAKLKPCDIMPCYIYINALSISIEQEKWKHFSEINWTGMKFIRKTFFRTLNHFDILLFLFHFWQTWCICYEHKYQRVSAPISFYSVMIFALCSGHTITDETVEQKRNHSLATSKRVWIQWLQQPWCDTRASTALLHWLKPSRAVCIFVYAPADGQVKGRRCVRLSNTKGNFCGVGQSNGMRRINAGCGIVLTVLRFFFSGRAPSAPVLSWEKVWVCFGFFVHNEYLLNKT